jgi:hypothetical protein
MNFKKSNAVEVLQILPYSSTGPIHGGKIRAREIRSILITEFVKVETVFLGDMEFSEEKQDFELAGIPISLVGDLNLLRNNYKLDEMKFQNLKIIIFEQPWAWNEVKRLKNSNPNSILIYSAHNIEHQLKERVLRPIFGKRVVGIAKQIKDLEIEIAKTVDYLIAVSKEDASWYAQHSIKPPIVAQNGTSIRESIIHNQSEERFPYGLVIGSAHPPNIEGCLRYLDDPELWLPRSTQIIVAGSLSIALRDSWGHLQNRWGQQCVNLIPEVNDFDLMELISGSHLLLLPIAYGGGTNLKTPEALASERPVVGTEQAFRGFRDFSRGDSISVVDNSLDFKLATIQNLMKPKQKFVKRNVSNLIWDQTLGSIRDLMRGIKNA